VLDGLSLQSHEVKVVLNGTELGRIAFRDQATVSKRFRLPRGVVHKGANSLTLTSVGGELDYSFVDTVRLTYSRTYSARHGALRFSLGAGARGRLTGFARANVSVIDVTQPRKPRLLRPAVTRSGGSNTAFIAPASRARKLFAVTTNAAPAAVVRNRPSDWN